MIKSLFASLLGHTQGGGHLLSAMINTHKTLIQAVRLTPSIPMALVGYSLFGCVLGTTSFTMLWFSKERGFNTRYAAATSGFIQVRHARHNCPKHSIVPLRLLPLSDDAVYRVLRSPSRPLVRREASLAV